jgi:hypothetical protein
MAIQGTVQELDLVTYEDRANPRRLFLVSRIGRGEYELVAIEDGDKSWSDLRQAGWERVGTLIGSETGPCGVHDFVTGGTCVRVRRHAPFHLLADGAAFGICVEDAGGGPS